MGKDRRGKNKDVEVPYLCEELITDIVSRLSVADLRRCNCVCNLWRRNIVPFALSSRSRLALVQFIEKSHVFYYFPTLLNPNLSIVSPDSLFSVGAGNLDFFELLLSCNGFTLFFRLKFEDGGFNLTFDRRLVVHNPITAKVHCVVSPESSLLSIWMIAFDPQISSHDFKIVNSAMEVYSWTSRKWVPMKCPAPAIWQINRRNEIIMTDVYCLNGFAYKLRNYRACDGSSFFMWVFHVENESLTLVKLPSWSIGVLKKRKDHDINGFHSLGDSAGQLWYGYQKNCSLWTWVFDQYAINGGLEYRWVARHKLNMGDDAAGVPSPLRAHWTLFFHPAESDVAIVVVSGKLYLMGLKTSKLWLVGELEMPSKRRPYCDRPPIFPFLLPPDVEPSDPLHTEA